ncbi:MAG: T9SS type A sorting domain-containing protein, partial [Flavobacteriales bacterium]|nr:T9SS type A sorting domain-containing protein [Flavobacteriales bacterium]
WDISPSSAAANTLMQLTWGTNPGIDEADLSNIVLAHYNSVAGYWEEIATTTSGGPASGSVSGTVRNFSPFTLGSKSSGNILPIDLISFTTNCNNDVVEVNFSVASQQNNDYFLVERSVDDIEWDEIGRLQGENESNNQKEYTILDFTPIDGMSYYRLTQVDYDGKFKTFSAVSNSCYTKETNLPIVVYPIPVVKKFTIEISIEDYQGSDVFYTITDLQGSVVLAKSVELNRGLNLLTMDIDHLSSGTYILSFNNTMNHIPNTKIIKR